MSSLERRKKILAEIERCICVDRAATYGDPEDNFALIAKLATLTLQEALSEGKFSARDVAIFMLCVKLARIQSSPEHMDHWVDMAGYSACGGAIVAAKKEAVEKADPEG